MHARNGVIQRLVLLVGAPLLAIGIGLLVLYHGEVRPSLQADIEAELRSINASEAVVAMSWINEQQRVVRLLASRAGSTGLAAESLLEDARWIAEDMESISAIIVADPDGNVLLDSIRGSGGGSISGRPYFQIALSGRSHVSGILEARTSSNPILMVAEPIRAAGRAEVQGVLAAVVTPAAAVRQITESFAAETTHAEIFDAMNQSISHADSAVNAEQFAPPVAVLGSVARYRNRDGIEVFGTASRMYPGGWMILTEKSFSDAMATLRRSNRVVAAGLGLTLAAALTLAVLAGRTITRPVAELEKLAMQLATRAGSTTDLPPLSARSPRELVRLHRQLSDMAAAIVAREQDIRHSNALLSATLDEKSLLLREVNHRVRNNLAVMRGIMTLSRDQYPADSAAYNAISSLFSRIAAMSLMHDQVYLADQVNELRLDAYLNGLAAIILYEHSDSAERIDLQSAIDDISLDPDQSLNVGLIVGELVHNAVVHAFPRGRSGRIELELTRTDASTMVISVEDDGVGGIQWQDADSSGLGLVLVDQLASQLQASVRAVSRDVGSRVELHLPLASPTVTPQPVSG